MYIGLRCFLGPSRLDLASRPTTHSRRAASLCAAKHRQLVHMHELRDAGAACSRFLLIDLESRTGDVGRKKTVH